MARFYSNENFPLPVVEELRKLGHDVLTTEEAGQSDQAISDEQVLLFSNSQERALLTFNRKHFIRLHISGTEHSGIVVCTFDIDFKGLASRIDKAIVSEENLSGKLIRINRPNSS